MQWFVALVHLYRLYHDAPMIRVVVLVHLYRLHCDAPMIRAVVLVNSVIEHVNIFPNLNMIPLIV